MYLQSLFRMAGNNDGEQKAREGRGRIMTVFSGARSNGRT